MISSLQTVLSLTFAFLLSVSNQSVAADAAYPGMVNLVDIANVKLDFRYATEKNFVNQNVYGSFNQCWLHSFAAKRLKKAAKELDRIKPGWSLLIFDCLRPRSIQKKFWNVVKGTEKQKYVANPDRGSIHNYGFAIDLSLADAQGKEVDMGTPFDHFGKLAEPQLEQSLLQEGQLNELQIENRKLLRKVMAHAGFTNLPIEWWHFEALNANWVRSNFPIIE